MCKQAVRWRQLNPATTFAHGKRLKNSYVTFIILPRDANKDNPLTHDLPGRVAFIAGKKLGNAVWRNSAKRRMRAICAELGGPWAGFDVVFLAKSCVTQANYSKVLNACDVTLSKAGFSVETDAE